MDDKIRLNCLIIVDAPIGGFFDIVVKVHSPFSELAQKIAEYGYPDTKPTELLLWRPNRKFRIPDAPAYKLLSNVQPVNLDSESVMYMKDTMVRLDPSRLIKDEFDPPLDPGLIHVLVQDPSTAKTAQTLYDRFWGEPLHQTLRELRLREADEAQTSDDSDSQDDVLSGAPIMKIDPRFRILVRAEYLRVFDEVARIYSAGFETWNNINLAVVTGQVGIGKSCWVYYAIARCLGDSRPVILYKGSTFWLLSSSGVRSIDPQNIESITPDGRPGEPLWCFIDVNHATTPLSVWMYGRDEHLFPILVSTLTQDELGKHTKRDVHHTIMNPWTLSELEVARSLLYPNQSRAELCERYKTAGGNARICLVYNEGLYEDFLLRQHKEILDLTQPKALVKFIRNSSDWTFDPTTSYLVCSIRRYSNDEYNMGVMDEYRVDPLTPSVGRRIKGLVEKLYERGAFEEAGVYSIYTAMLHGSFVDLVPRRLHRS